MKGKTPSGTKSNRPTLPESKATGAKDEENTPQSTLFDVLDGLKPKEGEGSDDFLVRLEAQAHGGNHTATLHRLKIGLELLARQPKKRGGRTKWQETTAQTLGIEARQLRNYLRAARSVEKAKVLELAVPIEALDRPLTAIPGALRAFELTEDINARVATKYSQLPAIDKLWSRFEAVIKRAEKLEGHEPWLFMRRARRYVGGSYETAKRPPVSEMMKGVAPVPMIGGYAGSKQSDVQPALEMLSVMTDYFPWGSLANTLVEPFCGLAAVSRYAQQLGLVDRVRLNDKDPAVAALITAVISDPVALSDRIDALKGTPDKTLLKSLWDLVTTARAKRSRQDGYEMPRIHHDSELAFAAAVLLACSRGQGLARGPSENWAKARWDAAKVDKAIWAWHNTFQQVEGNECTCYDAADVLKEPGWTLAFVDPPYVGTEHFYSSRFGDQEHRELQETLIRSRRPFLLTYGDAELVRSLYPSSDFNVVEHGVKQGMKKKGKRPELWITPKLDTIERADGTLGVIQGK